VQTKYANTKYFSSNFPESAFWMSPYEISRTDEVSVHATIQPITPYLGTQFVFEKCEMYIPFKSISFKNGLTSAKLRFYEALIIKSGLFSGWKH